MEKDSPIMIVGENSVEGKALFGHLISAGFQNVIGTHEEKLDLLSPKRVEDFFRAFKPEYIFLMHIRSGGILANMSAPAELIFTNLQVQNNIIHSSYKNSVKKLLYLASSCCYPAQCSQPMKEEFLFTGRVENTNEAYAVAKLAGIKMVQAYAQQYSMNCISVIPATIYGPGDNFDLKGGHVITSLIKKFIDAKIGHKKEVTVWGSGLPRREFIYIDDFVSACIMLMEHYSSPEAINIGVGYDIAIKELAVMIGSIAGFEGEIVMDKEKPDGVMQKLLDNQRIKKLGWLPQVELQQGILKTCAYYKSIAECIKNGENK